MIKMIRSIRNVFVIVLLSLVSCKNQEESKKAMEELNESVETIQEQKTELAPDIQIGDDLIAKYDFSSFFKTDYQGVFGEKRTPINFHIDAIKQTANKAVYEVKGYSEHQSTQVQFTGEITIDKVLTMNKNQVNVLMSYVFNEVEAAHGNGIFSGTGLGVKTSKGVFDDMNFIGEYIFENGVSVMCNFK